MMAQKQFSPMHVRLTVLGNIFRHKPSSSKNSNVTLEFRLISFGHLEAVYIADKLLDEFESRIQYTLRFPNIV